MKVEKSSNPFFIVYHLFFGGLVIHHDAPAKFTPEIWES